MAILFETVTLKVLGLISMIAAPKLGSAITALESEPRNRSPKFVSRAVGLETIGDVETRPWDTG